MVLKLGVMVAPYSEKEKKAIRNRASYMRWWNVYNKIKFISEDLEQREQIARLIYDFTNSIHGFSYKWNSKIHEETMEFLLWEKRNEQIS